MNKEALLKVHLGALYVIVGALLMSLTPLYDFPLYRYFLIRMIALAIGTPAVCDLMLIVDEVTPNKWMENISNDPKACAIIMGAVVLVIGAILCWT